ncbi:hypothetical protein ACM66B_006884 [Microbotryomycetes sp. NB124-2]
MSEVAERTRLLLSELALSVTTALLKQHVAGGPVEAGAITDAKVLTKNDGTSRRLAFVGCKTHSAASALKQWLDGTWLQGTAGGARIKVEWAKDTHDATRPRKRARLAEASAPPPTAMSSQPSTKHKDDDRFDQFMSVMAPRRNHAVEEHVEPELLPGVPQAAAAAQSSSATKQDSTQANASNNHLNDGVVVQASVLQDDGAALDDTVSDADYLARRMKRTLSDVDAEASIKWTQDNDAALSTSKDAADDPGGVRTPIILDENTGEDPQLALVKKTGRLFCRNLAFSVTEDDLTALFQPYGHLDEVHMVRDKVTHSSKGLAYVSFRTSEDAATAMQDLDGRTFQGRLLHILPSSEKRGHSQHEGSLTVKRARLAAKKADSGNAMSWATLYMSSDAVVSSVAERLGVTKAELLDPTSSDAAVKVALAETHVIAETRKYFEDEGVNVEALGVGGPRSSTTILVKNIPHGTSEATLRALFEPFGSVARLLLAPAGTMAVVEYDDADEAANAWRAMAYKKLGSSVLFLEKAPKAIWTGASPSATSQRDVAQLPDPQKVDSSTVSNEAGPPGSTLFVKNIAFATSEAAFARTFEQLPDFAFARLKTKPNPKAPGQVLSMGFGFVGFKSSAAAQAALRARTGFLLDGHQLEIKFAERGREQDERLIKARAGKKSNSTKLVIKNVPFEVTSKEIRDLVSAYGSVRSVRLPRKFDRKTRGFAFLDFASHQDAESTLSALQHTHLLGRHLIVQWAEEDGADLEDLRRKSSLSIQKPAQRGKFVLENR